MLTLKEGNLQELKVVSVTTQSQPTQSLVWGLSASSCIVLLRRNGREGQVQGSHSRRLQAESSLGSPPSPGTSIERKIIALLLDEAASIEGFVD